MIENVKVICAMTLILVLFTVVIMKAGEESRSHAQEQTKTTKPVRDEVSQKYLEYYTLPDTNSRDCVFLVLANELRLIREQLEKMNGLKTEALKDSK